MKSNLVKGLPTLLAAFLTIAGVVFPSLNDVIAQNPELVTAVSALLVAVANMTTPPQRAPKK